MSRHTSGTQSASPSRAVGLSSGIHGMSVAWVFRRAGATDDAVRTVLADVRDDAPADSQYTRRAVDEDL